jgi:hypothetical protein
MKLVNCNYWAMIQKPTRHIHGPNNEKAGIRTGFTVPWGSHSAEIQE